MIANDPTQTTDSGADGTITATVGAILAVDVGSLHTRAALFDIVGDEYRFIARASSPTTAEAPYNDVTSGVYSSITELEQTTGRKLTEGTRLLMPQRGNGSGIDLFIVTSSAAPALRLVVASISSNISQISALEAAQSTYTHIVSRITLDDGVNELPAEDEALLSSTAAIAWSQTQTDKMLALPPDVVLMSGGVDNGPVAPLIRLAKVLSASAREQSSRAERAAKTGHDAQGMPAVVFGGNPAALDAVVASLLPISDVTQVGNIRPTFGTERTGPAENALGAMYRDRRVPQIPGYSVLSRWVDGSIIPTAECTRLVARYLYEQYGRETLIADVGASSTSLFLANALRNQAVVLGDIGLAYGLGNLLAQRGPQNILRWLPFALDEEELIEWTLNKLVRPLMLPVTTRDLAIEHALAREALAAAVEAMSRSHTGEPPRYDLIVGTGGLLAHAPRPGQAALLMLDALQPSAQELGSVELAVDTTMLIPAIGNLAHHQPAAAGYIFDRDCLVWLGTAIVVREAGRSKKDAGDDNAAAAQPTAVTVVVERQQGGTDTVEVPYGSIQLVPLRPGQRAALTVKPGSGFRVGSGEPGKPLKTQPGQEVKGGLVGLIIDARGRPMPLASDGRQHVTNRLWWSALDAVAEQTAAAE